MGIKRRMSRPGAHASRVLCFASSRNTVPGYTSKPLIADLGRNQLIERIPARTRESAREDACAPV